jgi:hypothetical protein
VIVFLARLEGEIRAMMPITRYVVLYSAIIGGLTFLVVLVLPDKVQAGTVYYYRLGILINKDIIAVFMRFATGVFAAVVFACT